MKAEISEATIAAISASHGTRFLWDDRTIGFGAKILPSGRVSYLFQYRPKGGGTRRLTLGQDRAGWRVAEARELADTLRRQVADGREPQRMLKFASLAPQSLPATKPIDDPDWRIRLGYQIADVARFQLIALRRTIEALGGSHAQWRLLGRLSIDQGMTQSELAAALNLGKVAVSGLVGRAIKAGWIEARATPDDRRSRQLYLTAIARQAIARMRVEVDRMYDVAFAGLSEEDGTHLSAMVRSIAQALLPMARPNLRAGAGDTDDWY